MNTRNGGHTTELMCLFYLCESLGPLKKIGRAWRTCVQCMPAEGNKSSTSVHHVALVLYGNCDVWEILCTRGDDKNIYPRGHPVNSWHILKCDKVFRSRSFHGVTATHSMLLGVSWGQRTGHEIIVCGCRWLTKFWCLHEHRVAQPFFQHRVLGAFR